LPIALEAFVLLLDRMVLQHHTAFFSPYYNTSLLFSRTYTQKVSLIEPRTSMIKVQKSLIEPRTSMIKVEEWLIAKMH